MAWLIFFLMLFLLVSSLTAGLIFEYIKNKQNKDTVGDSSEISDKNIEVYGYWRDGSEGFECSNCQEVVKDSSNYNRCPCCKARMIRRMR